MPVLGLTPTGIGLSCSRRISAGKTKALKLEGGDAELLGSRAAQELFDAIREAVQQERYEVSIHADNRIEERRMTEWQIVTGVSAARLLKTRLHDRPWPSILLSETLPDGTEVYAKWSYRPRDRMARLVTIYYPE
jgi:phosphoribosylformimino-5-aminoimidazole carboxamide ribonucleotide (ProFAR) isomerase